MLIADYALLGLGGAVSCFAALRWERERAGRSLVLSFIGGAVCGLAWCLDAGIRLGSVACLLFLASYMAVLLRHGAEQEKSLVDILAAVSLSCGCFGMLRVVAGGAPWDFLPLPLLPGDAGADGRPGGLRRPGLFVPGVPGGGLAAVLLQGGDAGWGQAGEACAALCGLWPVPVAPRPGEECSLPTAALALFAFFGGLRLFCLVAAACRERESLRTGESSTGMTCRPT